MRPKTPQRQPPCIQFDSVHHEQQIGTPLMLKCVYFFKVRPILQYFFFCQHLMDAIFPFPKISAAALKHQTFTVLHFLKVLCRNFLYHLFSLPCFL